MFGIFRRVKPKCLGVVTEQDGTMRRCRALRVRNFGNDVHLCGVHHRQERATYVRDWAHPVEAFPADLPGELEA